MRAYRFLQDREEYHPVYLDLRGKKCLVGGGGEIAERKVEALLEAKGQNRSCPAVDGYLNLR